MDRPAPPTVRAVAFQTADVDEARALCRSFYYPVELDPLRWPDPFLFSFNVVQLGPITISEVEYGSDIRARCAELVTGYHVNVPLSGHIRSEHRGHVVASHPGRAAVYQPVGETVLRRWSADCRQLCVKIDRGALEDHLRAVLDRPIHAPLDLGPSMDVSGGLGRSWVRLVRLLVAEMANPDSLPYQAGVGTLLANSIMAGFLLAADHQYRDELLRPAAHCRPRTVKRAIDIMEADPTHAFTISELARCADVGIRTLQDGFRRSTGMAPMTYLRQLRLSLAHDELCRADARVVTVAEVAHRSGFTHLGRFAGAYREKYGVSPSTTLRYSS